MPTVTAYATDSPDAIFARTTIERREPGPTEVYFEIKYAGICHSDIHTAKGEWGTINYPLVPGHEIAGIVTKIGSDVTKFAVGDRVGVGCFVDSCGECEWCQADYEQYCTGRTGVVWTYNSVGRDGLPTAGGYSTGITVEQDYVCRIPDAIPLENAAPLLCAGITTYSPLAHWKVGPGSKVAVIGLGGLGHMAVQIAAAMGAEVSVISQTRAKEADGLAMGATSYYAMNEEGTLKSLRGTFDLIINTVSVALNFNHLIATLRPEGTLCNVGLPPEPIQLNLNSVINGRRSLSGSNIGGIAETQEMLDFCAEHGIAAKVEVIGGEDITEAYNRVINSDVRYRFVIDTSTFDA